MKKLLDLPFLFVIISISPLAAQTKFKSSAETYHLNPTVDKRVELLSIVFRLAGNQEYNSDFFKKYVGDINNHFAPYSKHPLILFARELAQEKSIGFDAVMAMAIHLQQPPLLEPIVSFHDRLPEQRWTIQ